MNTQELSTTYNELLALAREVIDAAESAATKDERDELRRHLAKKIVTHATTLSHLQAADPPDHGAILMVANAALEAYFTIFETVIESLPDDESTYRYAVYQVNSLQAAGRYFKQNPSAEGKDPAQIEKIRTQVEAITKWQERIEQTAHYTTLTRKQQKASRNGNQFPERSRVKLAEVIGLGSDNVQTLFRYNNDYAKSDYLAVAQLLAADTPERKADYVQRSISIVAKVMALLIAHYVETFPEAAAITAKQPELMQQIEAITST